MYRKFQFAFALLSAISMQSVYTKMTAFNLDSLLFLGSVFTLFILIINKKNIQMSRNLLSIWLVVLSLFILSIIYRFFIFDQQYNLSANIIVSFLFSIYLFLIILYFDSYEKNVFIYLKDLENIIFLLGKMSLIFFVFGQIFKIIPPIANIQISWGGMKIINSWLYLHFNAQGEPYGIFDFGRNTGIFVEAPQFAFMLCLGLAIYMFFYKKVNISKVIIYCLTIFTTLSTTGQIVCLLIVLLKYLLKTEKSKQMKALKLVVVVFGMISFSYSVLVLYKSKMDFGNSYNIRGANFQNAIESFFKYPLFGVGFKADTLGIGGGNTSTFTQVIQEGGIIFFCIYFIGIFIFTMKSLKMRRFNWMFFSLVYLVLLYPTVMTYTQLSVIFVSMFIVFDSNQKIWFQNFDNFV